MKTKLTPEQEAALRSLKLLNQQEAAVVIGEYMWFECMNVADGFRFVAGALEVTNRVR